MKTALDELLPVFLAAPPGKHAGSLTQRKQAEHNQTVSSDEKAAGIVMANVLLKYYKGMGRVR